MATTETLNKDEDCSNIETELKDIEHKVQKRKKYICRAIVILLVSAIIICICITFYFSTSGGCGTGKDGYPVCADESVMSQKGHGTCIETVQNPLRWNCDRDTADRICCFNRDYAEYSGYWKTTQFQDEVDRNNITTFYDSVSGKALFKAPKGRSFDEFESESSHHGWPSFRDEEVIWENVRCLDDGECVSVDGTHLGHNIPDFSGNRYCINIVSVAGYQLAPR